MDRELAPDQILYLRTQSTRRLVSSLADKQRDLLVKVDAELALMERILSATVPAPESFFEILTIQTLEDTLASALVKIDTVTSQEHVGKGRET